MKRPISYPLGMSEHLVVVTLASPAVLALGWIVIRMLMATFLAAGKAKAEWPALADSLGFEALSPRVEGRVVGTGALEGRHHDRKVRLETGYVTGSGSRQAASPFTSWLTHADTGLTIEQQKIVDRLLPQSDLQTGDAAFDKEFSIAGDPETVARVLTPAARKAITAYTRALGGFSLSTEGLLHRADKVVLDANSLRAPLDWQAWVLSALTPGASQGPTPVALPPRAGPQASWSLGLAILLIVASGGATSVYTANAAKAPSSATGEAPAALLGERFLANFENSGNWYLAVAVNSTSVDVEVVYADGAVETHPADVLRIDGLGPGSRVQAPRRNGNAACVLVERRGTAVRVRYSDGTHSWLSLGQVYVSDVDVDQQGVAHPEGNPEEILAIWKDERWLYPGTVVGRQEGKIQVLFEDGSVDWRTPEQVRTSPWKGGDPLEVKVGDSWKAAFYAQRLAGGHAVGVDMDGQIHWTALARIRRRARD